MTIDVRVLIGGTGRTWGASPVWYIAEEAFSLSVQRGRNDIGQPFQAGTARVLFRNIDGKYDPDNPSSPLFGILEPGAPITINPLLVDPDDPFAPAPFVFSGFINDIELSYDVSGQSTATITAIDGLAILAQQQIPAGTSFSAELTSTRFTNVINLPAVDWPYATDIDTGNATCAAATVEDNALQYLNKIANTEQGAVFVDRTGRLAFVNRYDMLQAATIIFADDNTGEDYQRIQRLVSAFDLFNRFSANRTGQPSVVYNTSTSQTIFGIRNIDFGEVLVSTDAEVTDLLAFASIRFNRPTLAVSELTTVLDTKPVKDQRAICFLELTNSMNVKFTPPNAAQVEVPSTIQSIRHEYTIGTGWRVTFGLTPRDASNYLRLNDTVLGRLDFNVLAY